MHNQYPQGSPATDHDDREDSLKLAELEGKRADLTPLLAAAITRYARRRAPQR